MTVKSHVTYHIERDGFTATFDAPPNLTLDGLRAYLASHSMPLADALNGLTDAEWDAVVAKSITAKQEMVALPDWGSITADQAQAKINGVMAGMTKAEVEAKINADVTSLATAKTAMIWLAKETVEMRDILKKMVRAIIHLRDQAL